ncbi:MAG: hypothetical protein ABSF61_13525 [Anaerolineales bacterium]|jgi:hypothetical protein
MTEPAQFTSHRKSGHSSYLSPGNASSGSFAQARAQRRAIKVRLPDGRFAYVGYVEGNTYFKVAKSCYDPPGFGFSPCELEEALSLRAVNVQVENRRAEGGKYLARIDAVAQSRIVKNMGFGPQVILPIEAWTIIEPPSVEVRPVADPDARQLRLSL